LAWTTPRTWATNETLTAANMNTHVRDNLNWLANDMPRCRATRTTTQAISPGSDVAISLTSAETYDVGVMHDTGSNPSRITVPSGGGGVYRIDGFLTTEAVTVTRAFGYLKVNGSTVICQTTVTPPSGAGIALCVSAQMSLVATDYVEMFLNHNDAASKNVTNAALAVSWVAF
jgi:hypothetical protein